MQITYLILFCTLSIFLKIILCDNPTGSPTTEKKVCYGTRNWLSWSNPPDMWYDRLKSNLEGCTYLIGNLEVTHLHSPDHIDVDLSFLSTIEVVTGYVLIGVLEADVIPLTRLRHIRGDEKFRYNGTDYALSVLLVDSRNGLQLPAIKEISGNVVFKYWTSCYGPSIAWESFTQGNITNVPEIGTDCEDCDPVCTDTDGVSRCWGPGKDLCQRVDWTECNWLCRNGTCFKEGMLGCCHPECLGCYDHWVDSECQTCRHFNFEGHCVPECPPGTHAYIDTCMPNKGPNFP